MYVLQLLEVSSYSCLSFFFIVILVLCFFVWHCLSHPLSTSVNKQSEIFRSRRILRRLGFSWVDLLLLLLVVEVVGLLLLMVVVPRLMVRVVDFCLVEVVIFGQVSLLMMLVVSWRRLEAMSLLLLQVVMKLVSAVAVLEVPSVLLSVVESN